MASSPDCQPLEGLRVLEFPHHTRGAKCGQLLADLGAEVILVECEAIAPLQGRSSPEFVAFNRNKKSVRIDPATPDGRRALAALVAGADAAIESHSPGEADRLGFGAATLRESNPALLYVSVTAFGHTGPWRGKSSADLVVQALTAAMDVTGEPGRPPVTMGLPFGDEVAGLLGAIAVLAGVARREKGGRASTFDISAFDASVAMLSYMAAIYFATGRGAKRLGSAHPTIAPYSAFKTSDSYVVAAPFTQTFWRKFCKVLGREDLPESPLYKTFSDRLKNRDSLSGVIDPILASRTLADWRAALTKGDVPNGPVNTVAEALGMDQTIARGMVAEVSDATGARVRTLGVPFRFDFQGEAAFAPRYAAVPAAGSTPIDAIAPKTPPARGTGADAAPLAGIRVLDITRMFAGPFCGQLLADLGADVIKIEEPRTGDPTRRNIPTVNGESTYFMAVNRGKRSLTLDMKQPEGRDVVLALLATADVVVENFRPGVMDRLGLSYADMRRVKPDIVVLSMSGFGHTGPLSDKISFDLVNQAMAGTMAITGEAGRPPVRIGYPAGDLSGGIFGTFAVLAALHARRRTGRGSRIDLSLHDLMVSVLGAHAQSYFSTGVCPQALGSSHRDVVPHRAYEASDGWLVMGATTDAEWTRLATVIERPDLAADARYGTAAGRVAHRAEIDAAIEAAVARRSVADWVARCDPAGVPCASVLSIGQSLDSVHAIERGIVISFDHPVAGRCRAVGMGVNADGRLMLAPLPPPALGQHNDEILGSLPGYDAARIASLREAKVIA